MEGEKTSGISLPDGLSTTNCSRTTYAGSSRSLACTTYTKKMGRSTISKISSAMCLNPSSRSQRIRRHTRSCTSFYNALSALIRLTTSQKPSVDTTGNSLTPNSGTTANHHLIRTGCITCLQIWQVSISGVEPVDSVDLSFRGIDVSLIKNSRHIRLSSTRWRGR
jgi:hypothetical protein